MMKSRDLPYLNVYSWVNVLKHLDFASLLNVAQVSTAFYNLIQLHASSICEKCLFLCDLKLLDAHQLKAFFDLFGRTTRVIKVCPHSKCMSENDNRRSTITQNYADYIGKYCTNLEEILWVEIDADALRQLVLRCKQLTRICLMNCNINDEDVLMFCDLPNLKSLEFCILNNMRGTHLYKLQQLNRLGIRSYMILSENVLKICKNYGKNLVYLDIGEVFFWPSDGLNEALNYCPLLEWVKLPVGHVIESTVPKLKGIEIDDMETSVDGTLESLARTQSKSLQVLRYKDLTGGTSMQEIANSVCRMHELKELSCTLNDECLYSFHTLQNLQYLQLFFCDDVTNNGILHVIKNCKNLYILGLHTCDRAVITEQLIFDAIDVLLEQQHLGQRNAELLPMWLLLNKNQIGDSCLKDTRYESAKSVLRIRYDGNYKVLLRHELKSIHKVFDSYYA